MGSESGENDSEIENTEFFPVIPPEKTKIQKDDLTDQVTDQQLSSSELELLLYPWLYMELDLPRTSAQKAQVCLTLYERVLG